MAYKKNRSSYGYRSSSESHRERLESEAMHVGRDYMEGRKSIGEVESYLNHTDHFQGYLSRSEVSKLVAKGARYSEDEGKAIKSRVQPEQDPHLKPKAKRNAEQLAIKAGGKLANRPEHTKYRPAPKPTAKARPNARNAYDVKAQRKKDLKLLLDKHTRGESGVKEVKRESRGAAAGKAYKNVVFNETRHKYVGRNRLGAKR